MKKKIGTMDLILLIIGVFLTVFTTAMIVIHCITGSTPDTLITCVYNTCGFECGAMGVIKSVKIFNLKRKSKDQSEKQCEEIHETTELEENYEV